MNAIQYNTVRYNKVTLGVDNIFSRNLNTDYACVLTVHMLLLDISDINRRHLASVIVKVSYINMYKNTSITFNTFNTLDIY
jgi:hypothetical protein